MSRLRSRPAGPLAGAALVIAAWAAAAGCALGGEDPGCHGDGECDPGFVCRAGACFRFMTEAGAPHDPSASDAAADAGAAEGGPDAADASASDAGGS